VLELLFFTRLFNFCVFHEREGYLESLTKYVCNYDEIEHVTSLYSLIGLIYQKKSYYLFWLVKQFIQSYII